jgi:hypothetical protein
MAILFELLVFQSAVIDVDFSFIWEVEHFFGEKERYYWYKMNIFAE